MVTDASGEIANVIALTNSASKGKNGGREIPLHPELRSALVALQAARGVALSASSAALDGP
jgi:hypothetical protein